MEADVIDLTVDDNSSYDEVLDISLCENDER